MFSLPLGITAAENHYRLQCCLISAVNVTTTLWGYKCKENLLKNPIYPTWAPTQMQRTKCTEDLSDFLPWASRFLCSRSVFCKLLSETISLLSTSLRMESADFPSWWMALLRDSSSGLIFEPSPSGSSSRAGGGIGDPTAAGSTGGTRASRTLEVTGQVCAWRQTPTSQLLLNYHSPCWGCSSPKRN